MLAARGQAERYAKALPASEGWPPFLIVVDVCHSIELYRDFSLTGKAYLTFSDPRTFRIPVDELRSRQYRSACDPFGSIRSRLIRHARPPRLRGRSQASSPLSPATWSCSTPPGGCRVFDTLHLHILCGGRKAAPRARLVELAPKPSRRRRQLSAAGRSALADYERWRFFAHPPQPHSQVQRRPLRIHSGTSTHT